MALRSCSKNGSGSRRWQRSLDSQEFGFASSLIDDVAPADELFFKGQLLPLLKDPRTNLVHSLCSTASHDSYGTPASLESCRFTAHNLGKPTSCRLEQGASFQHQTAGESRQSKASVNEILLKHMHSLQNCKENSSFIKNSEDLEAFSLSAAAMDCGNAANRLASRRSGGHGVLSWDEDEDVLDSCRHGPAIVSCKTDGGTNRATMLRSSSFRSQNSGFWDSCTEKDMMDSNSSRDSNGSSQDSYVNRNQTLGSKFFKQGLHPDHPHVRPILSFNILDWKPGFLKRSACRKQAASQNSSFRPVVAEDLFNRKDCFTPPSPEPEAALLPWNLQSENYKSEKKQNKLRARMSEATDLSDAKTIRAARRSNPEVSTKTLSLSYAMALNLKSGRASTEGSACLGDVEVGEGAGMKNQRKRWQICGRALKPLFDRKGWIGQFGMMDSCVKKAYSEVEHGTLLLHSSKTAGDGKLMVQRRLSHQPNRIDFAVKINTSLSPQQKQCIHEPSNSPAMSSCPSSTVSSPNRSGILDLFDALQKLTNSPKSPISVKNQRKIPSVLLKSHSDVCNSFLGAGEGSIQGAGTPFNDCNNIYKSVSTVQELQCDLQSAIAHCKESNKKLIVANSANI